MAKSDDPSRIDEQLVVTVDAQLFYSVLNALPYLVNYPYECTEQTLNRFVSTGIVSSLYRDYPAVAKMARGDVEARHAARGLGRAGSDRRMALEETPWLETAKGGKDAGSGLVKVLDPRIAKAEREASLAKLRKAQTALGRLSVVAGRAAVAVHDALHPVRHGEGLRVRRRRAEGHGAARAGATWRRTSATSTRSGWPRTSATGSG